MLKMLLNVLGLICFSKGRKLDVAYIMTTLIGKHPASVLLRRLPVNTGVNYFFLSPTEFSR